MKTFTLAKHYIYFVRSLVAGFVLSIALRKEKGLCHMDNDCEAENHWFALYRAL